MSGIIPVGAFFLFHLYIHTYWYFNAHLFTQHACFPFAVNLPCKPSRALSHQPSPLMLSLVLMCTVSHARVPRLAFALSLMLVCTVLCSRAPSLAFMCPVSFMCLISHVCTVSCAHVHHLCAAIAYSVDNLKEIGERNMLIFDLGQGHCR